MLAQNDLDTNSMLKMEEDPRIFLFGHKLRNWSINECYHSMSNHKTGITDFEEVVALDMKYIQNWSISEDIKIIAKTFEVALKREGSR